MSAVRPRRSVLYVPASNPRALAKLPSLDADVVILDLEDAVTPSAKDDARAALVAVLAADAIRAERVVRVNGAGTPWIEADLAALGAAAAAGRGPDAVLLAKVESPGTVAAAADALVRAGTARPVIWCMIETPAGVLNAPAIAAAQGVAALVLGTSDLVADLGARHVPGRAPLAAALGWVVLAARAAGCAVLDGVHLDLEDHAGFEDACRQGRDFGFDGKTLIHPRTIEAANRIFAADAAEVAEARRIVAAVDAARAAGQGVAVLDGRLVEELHARAARRLVALAEAISGR